MAEEIAGGCKVRTLLLTFHSEREKKIKFLALFKLIIYKGRWESLFKRKQQWQLY